MSKMDSFFNLSPLNTTVSRKVISFSDISAVKFCRGKVSFAVADVGHRILYGSLNVVTATEESFEFPLNTALKED